MRARYVPNPLRVRPPEQQPVRQGSTVMFPSVYLLSLFALSSVWVPVHLRPRRRAEWNHFSVWNHSRPAVWNHSRPGLLLRSVTLLEHLSSCLCERERLHRSSHCCNTSRRELAFLLCARPRRVRARRRRGRSRYPYHPSRARPPSLDRDGVGGARGAVSATARAEPCEAVLVALNSTPLLPK